MNRLGISGIGLIILLAVGMQSALAHKIRLFASVEGAFITGMVYLSDSKRVKHQRVVARTAEGRVLGETTTDEQGEFRLPVTTVVDHYLSVDLGDGHRAEFVIRATELPPQTTPSRELVPSSDTAAATPAAQTNPEPIPSINGHEVVSVNVSPQELSRIINDALSTQLRPLRQQLDQYEDKIRWHDVLGGLGYIFGLAGVAYYLVSRRSSS